MILLYNMNGTPYMTTEFGDSKTFAGSYPNVEQGVYQEGGKKKRVRKSTKSKKSKRKRVLKKRKTKKNKKKKKKIN